MRPAIHAGGFLPPKRGRKKTMLLCTCLILCLAQHSQLVCWPQTKACNRKKGMYFSSQEEKLRRRRLNKDKQDVSIVQAHHFCFRLPLQTLCVYVYIHTILSPPILVRTYVCMCQRFLGLLYEREEWGSKWVNPIRPWPMEGKSGPS